MGATNLARKKGEIHAREGSVKGDKKWIKSWQMNRAFLSPRSGFCPPKLTRLQIKDSFFGSFRKSNTRREATSISSIVSVISIPITVTSTIVTIVVPAVPTITPVLIVSIALVVVSAIVAIISRAAITLVVVRPTLR